MSMKNKIIEQLNWRYATKVFNKNKKVEDKDLNILLEAMRLSPSSFGIQPWKFVLVKNAQIREKIKEAAYGQNQITDASYLLVFCAKTKIAESDIDKLVGDNKDYKNVIMGAITNRSDHDLLNWNARQVYIALGFLLETCALMKIDACPMEGFDNAKVDEILGLKEMGLTSMVMCPIGYRSNEDKYSKKEKFRFCLEELVLKVE